MPQAKKILKVAVISIVFLWILSIIPFSSKIEQEIPAAIYKNGVVSEQTHVSISGKRTNYLFRDNSFEGIFFIHAIEKTGREEMWAFIQWNGKTYPQIFHYNSHTLSHNDIADSIIIINPEMTQFAVSLKDGSILATSDEVYKIYTEHITYDPERGVTSFKGNIPAF